MANEVRCSSCGDAARWLITLPYGEDSFAGRILAYCTQCRVRNSGVVVSIPLDLVSDDVFLKLYELGYTESPPDTATEITFGEEGAPTAKVWRYVPRDPTAARFCPVCQERLPDGANLYRVYCSSRCSHLQATRKRSGVPTVWAKRCGRCGAWFESHMRVAKWCSDRCRTAKFSR